jgi:hypothetical protein
VAESSRKNAMRWRGYVGSMGTYAPPAFSVPYSATIISSERSIHTPTSVSGPTPRRRKWWAS